MSLDRPPEEARTAAAGEGPPVRPAVGTWPERLLLHLYGWLMWLVQPLLRRKLARRGVVEPGYRGAVAERFGHYAQPAVESVAGPEGAGYVWLHAVSLGETRAAAVLVAALRRRLPGMRLLLTHGTATGRAEGQRLLQPGDVQVWQPWDAPAVVARFLTHFKPRVGILMETEIWPSLVAACASRGVPLLLANARMSEKTLRQSLRISGLALPAYRGLRAVYAQTEGDAQRLRQLQAPLAGVFGNLKFDATPDAEQLARGRRWRAAHFAASGRPVVLFASAREAEEAAFLGCLRALPPAQQATLQCLIVPRHPQRFDEVAALIAQQGFSVSRRSGWGDGPPGDDGASAGDRQPSSIWLGDSLGEMALYYGLADLALLGGSFEPLGGQNLIEAAACGCPIVMGPHTFNFSEAATLAEAAGAAQRASDMADALRMACRMSAHEEARQAAADAGLRFAASHRGAAGRTADAVLALVSETARR